MAKAELIRRSDWEPRLGGLIAERRAWPFAWGSHDCALWAAAWVEAVTGIDLGGPYRGTYDDAAGAAAALRAHGAGTLVRTLDSHFHRVHRASAQRGDLALHQGGVGGVWVADAYFVGLEGERDGLVRIPRRQWSLAWRVAR